VQVGVLMFFDLCHGDILHKRPNRDAITGERIPLPFFNFTPQEVYGTAIVGFFLGAFLSFWFMRSALRRQRQFEQQYGGRNK
jgi:hypothetical protein